jgi:hypothetical protein
MAFIMRHDGRKACAVRNCPETDLQGVARDMIPQDLALAVQRDHHHGGVTRPFFAICE